MGYKLTTSTFDQKEIQATIQVIKSGKLTLGKKIKH